MNKNGKLIFTVGLECSGKTTWSKNICQKDSNHFRVSLDDLRLMRGRYDISKDEGLIKSTAFFAIANAISFGKSVIFDAMNLTEESRHKTVKEVSGWLGSMGYSQDFEVYTKFFTDVDIRQLFARCRKRKDERGITENLIYSTWKQHRDILPKLYAPNEEAPKAVIFDIDGTIAKMQSRSPFDWKKVGEDAPIEDIMDLVRMFLHQGFKITFMSGRSEVCREETMKWLIDNMGEGIENQSELFMRGEEDNRRDDIVKLELFLNNVAPRYTVKYVFDDRNQVVDMWRNMLNLRCLQVAEGDF